MTKPITAHSTPWETVIVLCGKCARKMKGGYGPDQEDTLRHALRAELKNTGRRRQIRMIESRCLGVCPKKAVAALNASRPSDLLTVPQGTGVAETLARLLP